MTGEQSAAGSNPHTAYPQPLPPGQLLTRLAPLLLRERINSALSGADAIAEEEPMQCAPDVWTRRPAVLEGPGEADTSRASSLSCRGDP